MNVIQPEVRALLDALDPVLVCATKPSVLALYSDRPSIEVIRI